MADGMAYDPFAPLADSPGSMVPDSSARCARHQPAPHPLPAQIRHSRLGVPCQVWQYRAANDALLFVICRFDLRGGGKAVLPYTCGPDGWVWKGPPAPRPLYGLHRLAARPDAPVLVVEGEKAADAAGRLFPDHVAICWPGGAQAVGKADWSPLLGRDVTVWPDADAPGHQAAKAVLRALKAAQANRVTLVAVPQDWPAGWDVADFSVVDCPQPEGLTAETLRTMLADAVVALAADATATTISVSPDPRGRRDLLIDAAELPDAADAVAQALAPLPHLFYRGGPVRLQMDPHRKSRTVLPLTANGVIQETQSVLRPYEIAGPIHNPQRRNITLPKRVAELYLDRGPECGLRPLHGITTAPLLSPDGGIQGIEGYDPETGLWCESVPPLQVPQQPSRAEAKTALSRLRQYFRSFAFADAPRVTLPDGPVAVVDLEQPTGVDESTLLCALLTAVCRPSLPLAPGLMISAPQFSGAGAGKGLLLRTLCAIAFGRQPSAITAGATTEELEKRIAAALMGAIQILFLDNINGTALKSDLLASAITENPAEIRPLGHSRTVPLSSAAFIGVTGNGLSLSEDLARRFLMVQLDAGLEDPEARAFRGDLLAETGAARAGLLSDTLTIWRWGRQQGEGLPYGRPMGSFALWSRWCRDPLLALGCADPADRIAVAKSNDPRRQAALEILEAWWQQHGEQEMALKDLAEPVRVAVDPKGPSRQRLAAEIRKLVGARVGGFCLNVIPGRSRWDPDTFVLRRTVSTPEAPVP
jgi:hypothetical protein